MCGLAELRDALREPSVQLVVRNTFLNLDTPRPAPRRSASLPASSRLAGLAPGCKHPASRAPSSERSTEEECSAVADACTDANSSEADGASVDVDRSSTGGSEQARPVVLALDHMIDGQGPPRCGPQCPGTRLSSHAREWVPQQPAALAPAPPPPEFGFKVRKVVRAVTAALAGAKHVVGTDAIEAAHGWAIVAHILPDDLHHVERVLSSVKEALLHVVKDTEDVYVLGYRWRPFTATPLGFTARLAAVRSSQQACWGLLSKGFCRLGARCPWEHPVHLTEVNVAVQLK